MKLYYIIIVALGMLVFGAPTARSQELSFYKSEAQISQEKTSFNDIILFSGNVSEFGIQFFEKVDNLKYDSTFNSTCFLNERDFGSEIKCVLDPKATERGRLSLFYSIAGLVKNLQENKFIYKRDFKVPLKTKKLVVVTNLEAGLILLDQNNDLCISPFLPESGVKGSDGRRIYIFWERENVNKGDGISNHVVFEALNFSKSGQDLTAFYILFGTVIALIAGLFFYRTRQSGIKSAITILKDDERKVVQILEEMEGKAKQKQIQEKGDFSKATLSRLIKNLEERGLVKTERLGRSNRVYLNKELGKKENQNTGTPSETSSGSNAPK